MFLSGCVMFGWSRMSVAVPRRMLPVVRSMIFSSRCSSRSLLM